MFASIKNNICVVGELGQIYQFVFVNRYSLNTYFVPILNTFGPYPLRYYLNKFFKQSGIATLNGQ